jgi:hypothetical protein
MGLNLESDDDNKEEDDDKDFDSHPEDCHCLLSEIESSDSFEADLTNYSST